MKAYESLTIEIEQFSPPDILTSSKDITFDTGDGIWSGAYNT